MKFTNNHKESDDQRKKRIELLGTVQERIVPDKTKYTRKKKHKEREIHDDINN